MSKNDVAKIKAMVRGYVAACNAGDTGGMQKYLTSNAVFMPPDAAKLSGRKAIAAWAKQTYFDVFDNKLQIKFGRVEVYGRRATGSGTFSIELAPKMGGATMTGTGKHLDTFEKQKDGSWKYTQSIWNFDKPLA